MTETRVVHFIPPSQRKLTLLAAQDDTAPVLITGGDGSGKGAIAHWIHEHSARAARPLLMSNRSETLSHQIPLAHGGTFLIHELGEWPLTEQRHLLEYLRTRALSDGSNELRRLTNVRIIATTSQNLDGRAESGMFSQELLEKFRPYKIEMPNLNRRLDEFEDIAQNILIEVSAAAQKPFLTSLSPDAIVALKAHSWPANLRELRNVIRWAVHHCQTDRIAASDLPDLSAERLDLRKTRAQFDSVLDSILVGEPNPKV